MLQANSLPIIKLKTEYLRKTKAEFEQAIERLSSTHEQHPEEVEFMIHNWDIIQNELTWNEYREPKYLGDACYPWFSENQLLEAIDWISFFISHEIHDDGDASVVYLNQDHSGIQEITKSSTPQEVREIFLKRREAPWVSVPFEQINERTQPLLIISNYYCYGFENQAPVFPEAKYLSTALDLQPAVDLAKRHVQKLDELLKREPQKSSVLQIQLQSILEGSTNAN